MSKIHAACGAHQASFVAPRWFIDLTSGRLALTNTVRRLGYRLAGVFIVLEELWRLGVALVNIISASHPARVWIQSATAPSKQLKAGRQSESAHFPAGNSSIFNFKVLSFFKICMKNQVALFPRL